MTDRRGKGDYWAVRLDAEIRVWVRRLMGRRPGTWRSERALLQEIIHRGQLTFDGSAVSVPPPSGREDELVHEVRRRISTSTRSSTVSEFDEDLQVALVQQLAAERGLDVDEEKAGDLLRRARKAN
jgi:hypothetical protein